MSEDLWTEMDPALEYLGNKEKYDNLRAVAVQLKEALEIAQAHAPCELYAAALEAARKAGL